MRKVHEYLIGYTFSHENGYGFGSLSMHTPKKIRLVDTGWINEKITENIIQSNDVKLKGKPTILSISYLGKFKRLK